MQLRRIEIEKGTSLYVLDITATFSPSAPGSG
jgi:hypothetical protein